VINANDLNASPTLPLPLQGGIAWNAGGFLVSADAIYLGGRETHDDEKERR
jgi:hypothetical protein